MSRIAERWQLLGDRAWTRDGRLCLWLIVASCLTTIVVAFLGPSTVTLNVGPANGSLLPPGSGGISEWIKTEDLERMQSYAAFDNGSAAEAAQAEETFDIF